jgi:hypothetical protein
MAKIIITYEYEPNLDHYPTGTETAAEAIRFDVDQVLNGNTYWGELLDGDGKITASVVD